VIGGAAHSAIWRSPAAGEPELRRHDDERLFGARRQMMRSRKALRRAGLTRRFIRRANGIAAWLKRASAALMKSCSRANREDRATIAVKELARPRRRH